MPPFCIKEEVYKTSHYKKHFFLRLFKNPQKYYMNDTVLIIKLSTEKGQGLNLPSEVRTSGSEAEILACLQ